MDQYLRVVAGLEIMLHTVAGGIDLCGQLLLSTGVNRVNRQRLVIVFRIVYLFILCPGFYSSDDTSSGVAMYCLGVFPPASVR